MHYDYQIVKGIIKLTGAIIYYHYNSECEPIRIYKMIEALSFYSESSSSP